MKSILAALLLALCAGGARAETWLTASLGSYHVERNGYCEINPGIGLEHELTRKVRFIAGSYQNSFCKPSSFIGASYMPLAFGMLRAGAALIGVTGYETDKNTKKDKLIWAALPVLAYEGARYGVNLVLLPPFSDFKGAVGLQLKLRFQ